MLLNIGLMIQDLDKVTEDVLDTPLVGMSLDIAQLLVKNYGDRQDGSERQKQKTAMEFQAFSMIK